MPQELYSKSPETENKPNVSQERNGETNSDISV